MKYSPSYFYRSMPKWKRKKDTILVRFFIRPISFLFSSICANLHISANAVSYFNILTAIASFVLFIMGDYVLSIVAAALVFVWLLFDCVDGNLARSYKKQPYGEYADAVGSYLLVPMLSVALGYHTYVFGGVFVEEGNLLVVFLSFLAAVSDTMMRLIYHKYKEVTRHMEELGIVKNYEDSRNDHSKVNSLRVRIESDGGVSGIIPPLVLFSVIFGFTDISLAYFLLYFTGSFVFMFFSLTFKTLKYRKESFSDPDDKDSAQQ